MVFTCPESFPLPEPVHSVLEASLSERRVKKATQRTVKERGKWGGADGIWGWGESRDRGRGGVR